MVVCGLWKHDMAAWDRDCVYNIFGEDLGNRICNIPLINEGPEDRIIWFHLNNGIYTTKAGYSWIILKKIGYGSHRFFWRATWKMRVPTKIHIFA